MIRAGGAERGRQRNLVRGYRETQARLKTCITMKTKAVGASAVARRVSMTSRWWRRASGAWVHEGFGQGWGGTRGVTKSDCQ